MIEQRAFALKLMRGTLGAPDRFQLESSPGGGEGTRTHDPLLAKQVLYQLSYAPLGSPARLRVSSSSAGVVGLTGFEPVTSRLSGGCSNQLSYRPGISGSCGALSAPRLHEAPASLRERVDDGLRRPDPLTQLSLCPAACLQACGCKVGDLRLCVCIPMLALVPVLTGSRSS